jgi:lipoic acid synthetase
VEILVPDFSGNTALLQQVLDAEPEVFAHNLETVPRIFKRIRPGFRYQRSLDVIALAHATGLVTKSNLILGMGETREEIRSTMCELRERGCELITITQYLRPSAWHLPVDRWVHPEEFVEWEAQAAELGFLGVMSGPLVRSSYRAGRLYSAATAQRSRSA